MNVHRRLIVTRIDKFEILDAGVAQDIKFVATITLLDGERIKLALTDDAFETLAKSFADRAGDTILPVRKLPRKAA